MGSAERFTGVYPGGLPGPGGCKFPPKAAACSRRKGEKLREGGEADPPFYGPLMWGGAVGQENRPVGSGQVNQGSTWRGGRVPFAVTILGQSKSVLSRNLCVLRFHGSSSLKGINWAGQACGFLSEKSMPASAREPAHVPRPTQPLWKVGVQKCDDTRVLVEIPAERLRPQPASSHSRCSHGLPLASGSPLPKGVRFPTNNTTIYQQEKSNSLADQFYDCRPSWSGVCKLCQAREEEWGGSGGET